MNDVPHGMEWSIFFEVHSSFCLYLTNCIDKVYVKIHPLLKWLIFKIYILSCIYKKCRQLTEIWDILLFSNWTSFLQIFAMQKYVYCTMWLLTYNNPQSTYFLVSYLYFVIILGTHIVCTDSIYSIHCLCLI